MIVRSTAGRRLRAVILIEEPYWTTRLKRIQLISTITSNTSRAFPFWQFTLRAMCKNVDSVRLQSKYAIFRSYDLAVYPRNSVIRAKSLAQPSCIPLFCHRVCSRIWELAWQMELHNYPSDVRMKTQTSIEFSWWERYCRNVAWGTHSKSLALIIPD